jgi:hypothetical protein
MKHEDICHQVWIVSGALKGIGALLQRQSCELPYEHDELFGLGQLLTKLSGNLSELEDNLRINR